MCPFSFLRRESHGIREGSVKVVYLNKHVDTALSSYRLGVSLLTCKKMGQCRGACHVRRRGGGGGIRVCVCVSECIYMYKYVYVYLYIYMYIYICIYV